MEAAWGLLEWTRSGFKIENILLELVTCEDSLLASLHVLRKHMKEAQEYLLHIFAQ